MSMNGRKAGKSHPQGQREEPVRAAKTSNGGGAKATPNGKATGRHAAFSTCKNMKKQGTAAPVRNKTLAQSTHPNAPPKIIRPFRKQRSPERKSSTVASRTAPSSQERGRSTASCTRGVAPEASQVEKPRDKICVTRAARRDNTGAAGLGRNNGGDRGAGGGGIAVTRKIVTRAARRADVGGTGVGQRSSSSGGGGGISAVSDFDSAASSSATAGAAAGASARAPAPVSAVVSAAESARASSTSTTAAAASSTSATSSATAVYTSRKWALSRLAEAPPGKKRTDKKASSTSAKGVASKASVAAPAPKKKQWAPRFNSPRHYPILTAPKVRNSTSPTSTLLTVTTALGSTSESSSSMSDDDDDGEKACGFGSQGGGVGNKFLGNGGRPPPPKTSTEVALEAWAATRRAGRPAKKNEASRDPEHCYPSLMYRARESAQVTVRRVHVVRRGSGGSDGGGRSSSSSSGTMKPKDAAVVIPEGEQEEPDYAMVEFRLSNDGAVQGASGLFVALGLEVADAPAETPAKRPVGTPPRKELWAVTFPMVSKVTAGGFAETWGVTPGVRIIEVGRAFMGGKCSAKDIDKALVIRKRKDIKKNGKNNKNVNENAKTVTAVASLPSRVVFSMPQPPMSPRGNDAASPAAAKNDGGMAFLGLKVHGGRNLTELCWSVNLSPDEGPVFEARRGDNCIDLTDEERPEAAALLGFDVEWRQRTQGLQYIQVTSVTAGGLAARHGLQVGDMVLAVDGRHLVSRSTLFFWQHLKDRMQISGAHSPKSNWLRFLLVRKRAPQGVSTARKDKTPASKKTVSSSDPAAFVTGRRMLVKTKDSERGALGGGCVGGRRSPPTLDQTCPSKRPCPSDGGEESADEPASTPELDAPCVRQIDRLRKDRADARSRPYWWEKPPMKGSHRCVLRLRPAAALEGAAQGSSAIPGAFLCQDTNIGNLRIPSGTQLVSVDGKATRTMSFDETRKLALGGTVGTVLQFE